MAYHIIKPAVPTLGLSARRATIHELFLASYMLGTYHGCEFGCPYCDGWIANIHSFSDVIQVDPQLPQRVRAQLTQVSQGDVIGITTMSDAYQPAETTHRITRQVLQVLAERGQPCVLLTKSPLVLEDIDLLQEINRRSFVIVMTTLVSDDPSIAAKLESKAPSPAARLTMLAQLKQAGLPVGVAMIPVIPYLNDTPYAAGRLLQACVDAGADFVVWDYLHVPASNHRIRVQEVVTYTYKYPGSYYRDIYGNQPIPNKDYRLTSSQIILRACDQLGLAPHVPHQLYAGRISPANEAALLLKHAASRNILGEQTRLARLHTELANLVYQGRATRSQLLASPLWPQLKPLLGYDS